MTSPSPPPHGNREERQAGVRAARPPACARSQARATSDGPSGRRATGEGVRLERGRVNGERERGGPLGRRESPTCSALPLPLSLSSTESPSSSPLPIQFGRAVGVERKQERPRVVLLPRPSPRATASGSPPARAVSTQTAPPETGLHLEPISDISTSKQRRRSTQLT